MTAACCSRVVISLTLPVNRDGRCAPRPNTKFPSLHTFSFWIDISSLSFMPKLPIPLRSRSHPLSDSTSWTVFIFLIRDYCLVKQSNRYRKGSAAICDMRNDSITNRFSVKFISSSHSPSLHSQGWTFYGGKTKENASVERGTKNERARERPSNKLRSMVKNVFTWWKYDPSNFATSFESNPFDTTVPPKRHETERVREESERAGKWKYLSSNFHQYNGVGKITIQPQECLEGSVDVAHTPPRLPTLSNISTHTGSRFRVPTMVKTPREE